MFNLFDILQRQAGPGMQTIGQQFGLTPEQSRNAMNALLPAIAAGLQRSAASDPMGFGRMLGMVGPDSYFAPAQQAQAPRQPDFLGQLFGSPMLSQAVLQQASAASGIGQQALRQMLPVMAGMVVAGIVHVLINQPPAAAPAQNPAAPPPADPGFAAATFWNDWMNQFIGSPNPPSRSAEAPPAASSDAARPPKPAPKSDEPAKPEAPTAGTADEAPFEAFQQMFQTGVQVQEQNAKAMQDIFDAFWSPVSASDASGTASKSGEPSGPPSSFAPSVPEKEPNRQRRAQKPKSGNG